MLYPDAKTWRAAPRKSVLFFRHVRAWEKRMSPRSIGPARRLVPLLCRLPHRHVRYVPPYQGQPDRSRHARTVLGRDAAFTDAIYLEPNVHDHDLSAVAALP